MLNLALHFFMRNFIYIALVVLLVSFVPHKYYVSITEINFNEKEQLFEASIKFIGHDLEYALEKEGHPELHLGTEKEHEKANEIIFNFIKKHIEIMVNDKAVDIHFFGKEVRADDDMLVYFTSSPIDSISSVEVKSTILNNYFEEHVNIIYLTVGEQRFNFRLNDYKKSEKHQIKQE